MEKRIKRLETAVIALALMLIATIVLAGVAATELSAINRKLPDYQELKHDVQSLKTVYDVVENKIDSTEIHQTLSTAYDSTLSKTNKAIEYLIKERQQ
jgi:predicted PurR-regulated permease PerM